MRTLSLVVSLTVFASPALADRAPSGPRAQSPAPSPTAQAPAVPPRIASTPPLPATRQLSPIDPASVPDACRSLAQQAQAPAAAVAFPARISLASCMADRAIAPIALCDCGESIAAVDQAAGPAVAILDEVIDATQHIDPALQLIAEHAEGDLYVGFSTRLLATLPRPNPEAGEAEFTLRDLRHQTLEAQLGPWHETAMASFQRVVEVAQAHPEIAHQPVVAAAVRDSQQQLTANVASR
jgi:hypothetical protein